MKALAQKLNALFNRRENTEMAYEMFLERVWRASDIGRSVRESWKYQIFSTLRRNMFFFLIAVVIVLFILLYA
ncbi:MAG: hypothetical protein AAB972_02815 [Patescibacteria group bacterium]